MRLCVTCRRCWVLLVSWASLNPRVCLKPTLTDLRRSSSPQRQPITCQTPTRWNSLAAVTWGRWHRRRVWSVCRSLSTDNASVNCLVNISSTSSVSTSGSRYDTPPADGGGGELTIDDGDTFNSSHQQYLMCSQLIVWCAIVTKREFVLGLGLGLGLTLTLTLTLFVFIVVV